MKIDRQLQRKILEELANIYPDRNPNLLKAIPAESRKQYEANLLYLEEHGLIALQELHPLPHMSGLATMRSVFAPKITAQGIDFLQDDGGLAAILGVVTVRLHEDTLRALIGEKIEASELPKAEKDSMLKGLRELPAESIKHLTMKLIDKGFENLPVAMTMIKAALMGSPG